MSNERDRLLGELRQGAGGIDPVLDQAAGYGRAIEATRTLARQQGQVMSAALQNNHVLYHTNKELKRALDSAESQARAERVRATQLQTQLTAAQEYIVRLESAGGDKWKTLYEHARNVMLQSLHDTLTPGELKVRLDEMKGQAEELSKDPQVLTMEQIEKIRGET